MPALKEQKISFSFHSQWKAALHIVQKLQSKGFEALIAGGAVRDALLGLKQGNDLDIATSAEPQQVEDLFPQTVAIGKAFGVIRVIHEGQSLEVATYRLDQNYKDGRRPESVIFASREEDAKRRDFTVNALYYDITQDILYDDVGGLEDLKIKTLRAVGDPQKRFQEDELRRLRLIRFVSQLGFQIEEKTWKAVCDDVQGLQKISRERITEETYKMWKGEHLETAYRLWLKSGLAMQVDPFWIPEREYLMTPAQMACPRRTPEEVWAHYFSFFWQNGMSLTPRFEELKISKQIQNKVQKAFEIHFKAPYFLKWTWGEQRMTWDEPLAEWTLDSYFQNSPEWQQKKAQLKAAGPLPEPLVTGNDLLRTHQGAKLGAILRATYIEQLNQNWQTSEQALDWVRAHFSK